MSAFNLPFFMEFLIFGMVKTVWKFLLPVKKVRAFVGAFSKLFLKPQASCINQKCHLKKMTEQVKVTKSASLTPSSRYAQGVPLVSPIVTQLSCGEEPQQSAATAAARRGSAPGNWRGSTEGVHVR